MRRLLLWMRTHRRLLLGIAVVLVVVDGCGLWTLRRAGLLVRFVPVDDLDRLAVPEWSSAIGGDFRERFQSQDPLELMRGVMNAVGKIEPGGSSDPGRLYDHVRAGGGTLCDGMATLLYHALGANGLAARLVQLQRNLGDPVDSHVVVETQQDGRWILLDPTFNVTYERAGRMLGVVELARAYRDGSIVEVQPRFHGDVRYPARIDSYHMDWKPLFNNALVCDAPMSAWGKVPPWRWWFGPKLYYWNGPASTRHLDFANNLAWLFVVALPAGIMLIGSLGMGGIGARAVGVSANNSPRTATCRATTSC